MTDHLLVDDSLEAGEPQGPLADLKRQMRMLSQSSPVLAPGAEQAAEIAAEEQGAAPPAKTPRAAMSSGYADSHNPATMRLLRSGGTTHLLAETGSLREEGEEDEGLEEALAGGEVHGAGASGDNAPTARTGGTTKLLADMTMASSVGAKLLGRGVQGESGLLLVGCRGMGQRAWPVGLAPACLQQQCALLPAPPPTASACAHPSPASRLAARRHPRAGTARLWRRRRPHRLLSGFG